MNRLNQVASQGLLDITESLKKLPSLNTLKLTLSEGITDKKAHSINQTLKQLTSLKKLDIVFDSW